MAHEQVCLRVLSLDDIRYLPSERGKRLDVLNLFATGLADFCELIFLLYAEETTAKKVGGYTRCRRTCKRVENPGSWLGGCQNDTTQQA
jgi:hypothetical protein